MLLIEPLFGETVSANLNLRDAPYCPHNKNYITCEVENMKMMFLLGLSDISRVSPGSEHSGRGEYFSPHSNIKLKSSHARLKSSLYYFCGTARMCLENVTKLSLGSFPGRNI